MPDRKPILSYRPPGRDVQASLDRADRVLVIVGLAVVLIAVLILIFCLS